MDKVYIASCFTGGLSSGAYTTLDAAKQAIESHYKCLVMDAPGMVIESGMRWVKFHDSWAWLPIDFDAAQGNPWGHNNTQDGLMENVYIQVLPLDVALPVV